MVELALRRRRRRILGKAHTLATRTVPAAVHSTITGHQPRKRVPRHTLPGDGNPRGGEDLESSAGVVQFALRASAFFDELVRHVRECDPVDVETEIAHPPADDSYLVEVRISLVFDTWPEISPAEIEAVGAELHHLAQVAVRHVAMPHGDTYHVSLGVPGCGV